MAHPEQQTFCKSIRERFPEYFADVFVLDVGSLDTNGNNRYLFDNRSVYIGIDVALGPNVDFACTAHELTAPDETFDVVISTECLQHDRHWASTLQNATRMLRPGGMLLMTCATTGRPEHGTRRTSPENAPLLSGIDDDWADYYKNLDEYQIKSSIDTDKFFKLSEFSSNYDHSDLYFVGIKRGTFSRSQNRELSIAEDVGLIRPTDMKNSIVTAHKINKPPAKDLDLRKVVDCFSIKDILNSKEQAMDNNIFEHSTITDGEHFYRTPPVLFDTETADELAKKWLSSHYQSEIYFDKIKLYKINNAILTGTDQIITENGVLLSESAFEYFNFNGVPLNFVKTDKGKFFHCPRNTKIIDSASVLIKNLTEPANYGHFLVEAAASFALMRDHIRKNNWSVIMRTTTDMKMREIIYASLRIISEGTSLTFYERDKDEAWLVKELYYMTPIHVPPYKSRHAIKVLRDAILKSELMSGKKISSAAGKKLYVSRKFSGTRKIINEEIVYSLLKKRGFVRVFLDDMSFEDKIRVFKNAEIVVGPKGAGLTNCMFMPECASLLVLSPEDFEDPFFYDLASHANVNYAEVFCPVDQRSGRGRGFRDFLVPIKKLEGALQLLVGPRHRKPSMIKTIKNHNENSSSGVKTIVNAQTSAKNLLVLFEGLGNNCEFGIVQRHFGCDPPGLFRNVGFLSPDVLIDAIDRDLDGLFDDGNYEFTLPEGWKDWRIDSQGFMFHAGIPAEIAIGSEEWGRKSREALQAHRLLKRMFREELRTGEKIFVYRQKQPITLGDIRRLHAAIRKYGPGWLLNVVEDPSRPKGTIENHGDGLIIAITSVLSNEDPPNIDFEAWEMITREVLAMKEKQP